MRHTIQVALFALGLLVTAGCSRPPEEPPVDTGARDAARAFFEALGRRDWASVHSTLDPDGRRTCSREDLARRGAAYMKRVGFEPTAVRVPTCEERGDEATAHITLTGRGHNRHEYKDTVVLRKRDGKWGVVLPTGFGRS